MKVCSKCCEEKLASDFGKDKARKDCLNVYCKVCVREKSMHSYEAHKTNKLRKMRERRANEPTTQRQINQRSYENNKHKYVEARTAQAAKRRAAKRERTIGLSQECEAAIKAIYVEAARLTRTTGVQHHVDHRVPLQGKMMSGLHVPWNLEVIPARENLAKSNKVDYSRALPTCMDRVDA